MSGLHPEFHNGARNRRKGVSKNQSQKHLKRTPEGHQSRIANREGWEAMHVFLALDKIDNEVCDEEEAAERATKKSFGKPDLNRR
jgi:hypothetical protein